MPWLRHAPARASSVGGHGPYGLLDGRSADEHGLVLPEGFTARVVAEGGAPVAGANWTWPPFPDGMGTFPTDGGGWLLAVDHEIFDAYTPNGPRGGASTICFAADGTVVDAWPILEGSHSNSRGGTTPWGTWLSCQEAQGLAGGDGAGLVWECDPTGVRSAVPRPALGVRTHGSVAVDPSDGRCYLTEAHRDGRLYRFIPSLDPLGPDSLAEGRLEAMAVGADGAVSWLEVADPSGAVAPTRVQAAAASVTPMGGGVAVYDSTLWFTTGINDRVHIVDLAAGRHRLVWDGMRRRRPLAGIGDLAVSPSGEVFVAEDRDDMEVVVLSVDGEAYPFCRMVGDRHRLSAVTGPCFDPSGTRMYLGSMRGRGETLLRDVVPELDWGDGAEGRQVGVVYEVAGPFGAGSVTIVQPDEAASVSSTAVTTSTTTLAPKTTVAPSPSPAPTLATTTVPAPAPTSAPVAPASGNAVSGDGSSTVRSLGVMAVLAAGAAALALRRRRT